MRYEKKYKRIETGFLLYADALKVTEICSESDQEDFVQIPTKFLDGTCNVPFARKTVVEKLVGANRWLQRKNSSYQIIVLDAYRSLEEQEKRFGEVFDRIMPQMTGSTEIEILEECHKQIAVPSVAAHPTGGALDVMIRGLDFGTGYCEWGAGRKLYFASLEISKEARKNRRLLRKTMIRQGFFQYTPEWWHFSYGDKEWAFAKKKKKALYSQKQFTSC